MGKRTKFWDKCMKNFKGPALHWNEQSIAEMDAHEARPGNGKKNDAVPDPDVSLYDLFEGKK